MSWNIRQLDNGDVELTDDDGPSGAIIGRGSTDKDVTFLALRNADGELAYIFPNATQDGITVQATRP